MGVSEFTIKLVNLHGLDLKITVCDTVSILNQKKKKIKN